MVAMLILCVSLYFADEQIESRPVILLCFRDVAFHSSHDIVSVFLFIKYTREVKVTASV